MFLSSEMLKITKNACIHSENGTMDHSKKVSRLNIAIYLTDTAMSGHGRIASTWAMTLRS